jgi:hypothetical protein
VHLRLYRRVIEIRDGMLALKSFLPSTYAPATVATKEHSSTYASSTAPAKGKSDEFAPDTAQAKAQSISYAADTVQAEAEPDAYDQDTALSGARADAYGKAMLEARAIALALHRRAAGEPPCERPGSWAPVGPEMADEVAWLSLVARAYRRISPGAVRIPRPSGSVR